MNKTELNLEVPINGLSFGQVGFGVLHELFERKYLPNIFPLGNVDLGAFDFNQSFVDWLKFCINKSKSAYSRKYTTIKLWHIFDSERRLSDRQVLWTAHETDMFTSVEKNIMSNTDVVLFTSSYAKDTAEKNGLKNVDVCPNFFDYKHFGKDVGAKKVSDCINFSLIGKFERRKHTDRILKLWSDNFGNDPRYRLNCLISNPFFKDDQWVNIINSIFPNGVPWNINLIPRQEKNTSVAAIMQASDIDLSGLSGAEGFNLPCFNMLALNKICVVLDAHSHKDFIEDQKVFKVRPSEKLPIYDGMFFVQGNIANQGNMFSFADNEALEAIHNAINSFINGEVFKSDVAVKFSVSNTVDKLLSYV